MTSAVRSAPRRMRLASLPELIRTLPARPLVFCWLAIFSTFAMIGFVFDILARGRQPAASLALSVVAAGAISVGYAWASLPPRPQRYAVMLAIHAAYTVIVPRLFPVYAETPPGRLAFDALGIVMTVTVGYSCFLRFINVTAARYLRAQAEIVLARDIHRVLVPAIERSIGDYEFFGWSHASGDVGGDLVDLVEATATGSATWPTCRVTAWDRAW